MQWFTTLWSYWHTRRAVQEDRILALLRQQELSGLTLLDLMQERYPHMTIAYLYVLLYRLERRGMVSARWGTERVPERGGRRRRYYTAQEVA